MSIMFWVWLAVIVVTAIVEIITTDLVSIWFTFGAIIPFILATADVVGFEWQILIFVAISSILILSLRNITKKILLKNSNYKSNIDSIIGKQCRMLSKTDFETLGCVKINDVEWSAISFDGKEIEKNDIVEVVKVDGNKLIVKKVDKDLKGE